MALRDLRRLPSHGAQVRQRQYIGKLMRAIDPEPVLAKLAERKTRHDQEIRQFQQIERWRDRLLSDTGGRRRSCWPNFPRRTALPWCDCSTRPARAGGTAFAGRRARAFRLLAPAARIMTIETGAVMNALVGIIMGSSSDWETMQGAAETLTSLGVAPRGQGRVRASHARPAVRICRHGARTRPQGDHRRRRRRGASSRA